MCPRIIRALLCAATARAAAATSHVVDDFNTTEGMFTLTSQVPPVSTTEVTDQHGGAQGLQRRSCSPRRRDGGADGADDGTHGRAGVGRGGSRRAGSSRRAAHTSGLITHI